MKKRREFGSLDLKYFNPACARENFLNIKFQGENVQKNHQNRDKKDFFNIEYVTPSLLGTFG